MKNEELLTTAQVSRLAGCGRSTVQYWESTGKLMAVRIGADHGAFGGKMRLFLRDQVERFLSERRKTRRARARRKKRKGQ